MFELTEVYHLVTNLAFDTINLPLADVTFMVLLISLVAQFRILGCHLQDIHSTAEKKAQQVDTEMEKAAQKAAQRDKDVLMPSESEASQLGRNLLHVPSKENNGGTAPIKIEKTVVKKAQDRDLNFVEKRVEIAPSREVLLAVTTVQQVRERRSDKCLRHLERKGEDESTKETDKIRERLERLKIIRRMELDKCLKKFVQEHCGLLR